MRPKHMLRPNSGLATENPRRVYAGGDRPGLEKKQRFFYHEREEDKKIKEIVQIVQRQR
jgi:hypothetical protein